MGACASCTLVRAIAPWQAQDSINSDIAPGQGTLEAIDLYGSCAAVPQT